MKFDIKKRWVAALRSGKYKQGREALNTKGRLCCLGVLCELAVQDGIIKKGEPDKNGGVSYGAEAQRSVLPKRVVKWAGLSDPDPKVFDVDVDSPTKRRPNAFYFKTALSDINDESKRRFATIAKLIEAQL